MCDLCANICNTLLYSVTLCELVWPVGKHVNNGLMGIRHTYIHNKRRKGLFSFSFCVFMHTYICMLNVITLRLPLKTIISNIAAGFALRVCFSGHNNRKTFIKRLYISRQGSFGFHEICSLFSSSSGGSSFGVHERRGMAGSQRVR